MDQYAFAGESGIQALTIDEIDAIAGGKIAWDKVWSGVGTAAGGGAMIAGGVAATGATSGLAVFAGYVAVTAGAVAVVAGGAQVVEGLTS